MKSATLDKEGQERLLYYLIKEREQNGTGSVRVEPDVTRKSARR